VARELDVRRDALGDRGVRELLGDALAIGSIGDSGLGCRKIVLMVRVLDVSQELASLADQVEPSTQEVSSGTHFGWVDVSLRKHASSEQGCDLESIDAVVFCFAAVNGFHVERMS
jgi:hypothetical protein